MAMNNFKCVIVGDGAVGKTCMLVSYTKDTFPLDYVPTVFDNHTAHLIVDEKPVNLGLWDTAGQEDFDKLRPLSYSETDVFLVCYSIALRSSFENIDKKWVPEIQLHEPGCPYVLVATKMDLRENNKDESKKRSFVSTEEGQKLASQINAFSFVECSALTQMNLKKVFDEACQCVFESGESADREVDVLNGDRKPSKLGVEAESDGCCTLM